MSKTPITTWETDNFMICKALGLKYKDIIYTVIVVSVPVEAKLRLLIVDPVSGFCYPTRSPVVYELDQIVRHAYQYIMSLFNEMPSGSIIDVEHIPGPKIQISGQANVS